MVQKRRNRTKLILTHSQNFYNIFKNEIRLDDIDEDTEEDLRIRNLSIDFDQFEIQLFDKLLHYIKVPLNLEKFMFFGIVYCVNEFLKNFTIFPIQFFLILEQIFKSKKKLTFKRFIYLIYQPMVYLLLLTFTLLYLNNLDTFKLYHDIRRQNGIKLYVIIQLLEISDKLLTTFGQDLLTYLLNLKFIIYQNKNQKKSKVLYFKLLLIFFINLFYIIIHSIVIIYQIISLNVAINSYSNSLFTLILSSQFSEIKSAIFKKFDSLNYFQILISDLIERFQILIFLVIINFRNLLEFLKNNNNNHKSELDIFKMLVYPSIYVFGSEILVDWLKHCFITKYNFLSHKIYNSYLKILINDFIEIQFKKNYSKKNNNSSTLTEFDIINSNKNISKRLGLPIFIINIVFIKLAWPLANELILDDDMEHGIISAFKLTDSFPNLFFWRQIFTRYLNLLIFFFSIFVTFLLLRLITSFSLLRFSVSFKNRQHNKLYGRTSAVLPTPPSSPTLIPKTASPMKLPETTPLASKGNYYVPTNEMIIGTAALSKNDLDQIIEDDTLKINKNKIMSVHEKRLRKIEENNLKNSYKNDKILNNLFIDDTETELNNVVRYKMVSKNIY